MDPDDDRWTALALGEPTSPEAVEALGRDPEAREEVARTRAVATLLTAMYREQRRPRRRVRPWVLVAAAAMVAVFALWAWRLDRQSAAVTQAVARRAMPAVRAPSPAPVPAENVPLVGDIPGGQIVITTETE